MGYHTRPLTPPLLQNLGIVLKNGLRCIGRCVGQLPTFLLVTDASASARSMKSPIAIPILSVCPSVRPSVCNVAGFCENG